MKTASTRARKRERKRENGIRQILMKTLIYQLFNFFFAQLD
jgi:hypothetical protein